MRIVPASKPVTLSAKVSIGKVEKVKFEILNKATGALLTDSGETAVASGKASWNWIPNEGEKKALADTEDAVEVSCRVFWFGAGTSGSGGYIYLDDVKVFRDKISIKVAAEDGSAVRDAGVRLVVSRPGNSKPLQKGPLTANAEGIVEFDGIEQWESIGVVVTGAWVLKNAGAPWKESKDKGLNREVVVVPKKFKAVLKGIARSGKTNFATIPELGATRPQYVNYDLDHDPPQRIPEGLGEAHYAHIIDLKVGAEDCPNELVYVKFEPDAANSKRNDPKPMLSGQGKEADAQGILELKLDHASSAICTVELGYAGGDNFTLKVSSVKDFSATPDEVVQFQNWRKIFYELMAPEIMTASLGQANGNWDLPDDVRARVKKILDPVFIEYELVNSHIFPDDRVRLRTQLQPGTFFDQPATCRNFYIASDYTKQSTNESFGGAHGIHTIRTRLFDVLYDTEVQSTLHSFRCTQLENEIGASARTRFFIPDTKVATPEWMGITVKPLVASTVRWQAVIPDRSKYATTTSDGKTRYNHPGLDDAGMPRTGTLDASCFTAVTWKKVKITVPANGLPGSLIGPESAGKCPVDLTFTISEVEARGGGYQGGRIQSLCMIAGADSKPRSDILAHNLCHELGHALRMAPLGSTRIPPGLDPTKNVDEGGTYFRHSYLTTDVVGKKGIRKPGQGEHCATGITDKTVSEYPVEIPDSGCVMYWIGPPRASNPREEPFPFCTTCAEYLKAQAGNKLQ